MRDAPYLRLECWMSYTTQSIRGYQKEDDETRLMYFDEQECREVKQKLCAIVDTLFANAVAMRAAKGIKTPVRIES